MAAIKESAIYVFVSGHSVDNHNRVTFNLNISSTLNVARDSEQLLEPSTSAPTMSEQAEGMPSRAQDHRGVPNCPSNTPDLRRSSVGENQERGESLNMLDHIQMKKLLEMMKARDRQGLRY